MSDQAKNLKDEIRKAFIGVESEEFLEKQIRKGAGRHRNNFEEYIKLHPKSSFGEWAEKFQNQLNIHSTVPSEIVAIGISLLALDELATQINY